MSYLLFALKEKTAGIPRALRNQIKWLAKNRRGLTQKMPIRNWDDLNSDYWERADYAHSPRVRRLDDPREGYKTNLIGSHLTGKNLSNYTNPNININRLPFANNRRLPFANNRRQATDLLAFRLSNEQGRRPKGIADSLASLASREKGYKEKADAALKERMDAIKKKDDADLEKSMESILSRIGKKKK